MWCMSLASPTGSPLSTTADKLYLTRSTRAYPDTPFRLIEPTALIGEMGNHFVDTPPEIQRCITGNAMSTAGEEVAGSPTHKDLDGLRRSGCRLGRLTRPSGQTAADPYDVEDVGNIAELSRQESWHSQAWSQRARPEIALMTDRESDSPVRLASECKPLMRAAEERPQEEQDETKNVATQKYILFTFSS